MATDQQPGFQQTALAGPESADKRTQAGAGLQEASSETSLVPVSSEAPKDGAGRELSPLMKRIPIEIDVAIPIRRFQVRNVLALAEGQVIETSWFEGEDVPLAAPGARLAWTEIEVIDQKLAVRITRLA